MRLDQYITKNFDIQSRNKAHELIKNNKIKINGAIVTKPSYKVEDEDNIEILQTHNFVSRAAYKLQSFLDETPLDFTNYDCLDIGSSTGGFTQVLLQNGIKSISCVDVGSNQLHASIKTDPRISMFENTDIRDFKPNKQFDLVTCDVSFISLHHILQTIDTLAKNEIIILYKPQFEVGVNAKRDKKGVVTDVKAIELARLRFIDATTLLHWKLQKHIPSKIKGKEGNSEEFFYFTKV